MRIGRLRADLRGCVMDLFRKQKEFITRLENDLFFSQLKITLKQFDFVVIDYITNKQLFQKGIDGKGKKLEGYARTTIRIKKSKGDPTDRTTLRDKGEFYLLQVDAKDDGFEITTDVTYGKFIIGRYGKDVLRVSNENMKEFFEVYFIPNLKKAIKQ